MTCLFVIWLGDKPIEKAFTSLRILLWANVLNKILNESKNLFLFLFDIDKNDSFMKLMERLNLIENEDKYYIEILSNDQYELIHDRFKQSTLISYDEDKHILINIENVDNDYLLKSSNNKIVRLQDDNRLFDKLHSFGQILDKYNIHRVIHLCDFQTQYQCELFVILSKIIYYKHSNIKQNFMILGSAIVNDDRPTAKYDDLSVDKYIQDLLSNVVNERTAASSFIPMAIFKLQLMCRKQNSIVHLRSNLGTNHDILFLLYTGARLISILNSYNEKYRNGVYPTRESFYNQLNTMLTNKDEQEFLKWAESFESHFLVVNFNDSNNKLQINLDKIYQELILFCRRLSPYYSKVRILTENQSHLLPTMFARLELIERIVCLLRRTLSFIGVSLIERM